MAKRVRPKIEDMESQVQHTYDHRGETGKFGNIYNTDVESWRVKEGDHEFCIIPYSIAENSVFRTKNPDLNPAFSDEKIEAGKAWPHKLSVLIHYGVGVNKDAALCLRTLREACPICEERDRLIKEDEERYKEEIQDLGPAKRAVYNVVVFDNEKEMQKGIQVYEAPHSSIEDVLSEIWVNKRTGDKRYFTLPEEGWNVAFEKRGKGLGTEYRQVQILERRKEDEFTDKELDELYDVAHNLEEIIEIKSHAELKEMAFGSAAASKEEKEDRSSRGDRSKTEEEPTNGGRFRSRREEKVEEKVDESGSGNPKCFGIKNNLLDECEDCPGDLWKSCAKEVEKAKEANKSEKTRGRRAL